MVWLAVCAVNAQDQAFYGGRMTENRLLAVRNATTETIDHLHNSLESCPSEDTEAQDPKGIKASVHIQYYSLFILSCVVQDK